MGSTDDRDTNSSLGSEVLSGLSGPKDFGFLNLSQESAQFSQERLVFVPEPDLPEFKKESDIMEDDDIVDVDIFANNGNLGEVCAGLELGLSGDRNNNNGGRSGGNTFRQKTGKWGGKFKELIFDFADHLGVRKRG